MTIFYFTGTGNSLFAARKIADATGATLVSIPQAIAGQRAYTDDAIGFVYPQYANGLPKMVRRFIVNNTFKADYFFAVDLYAFIHINALGEIASLIPLNYGAYLKTPMNFILLFGAPKNPAAMLTKAESKLKKIINDIKSGVNKRVKPSKKIGNATKHFGESNFKVTAGCTRCGICVKACPAANIKLDEMIKFNNRCETCFACVNLCPAHAIYSKKAMLKRRQYRNPIISADEIIAANSTISGGIKMKIVNMQTLNEVQRTQAAQMLTDELPLGWANLADALEEIADRVDNIERDGDGESLFLAAVEDGQVLGWVGMLPTYNGKVYELHPLVVRSDMQRRGIGAALVRAIEKAAKERGGLTLQLGADDDSPGGETSLANVDLYDDLPRRIQEFEAGTHQAAFYMKLGFKIIGVMPDANGVGKPDIFLAKRL